MSKIQVVYWSETGSTQSMAEAVAEGIKEAGKEAVVLTAGSAAADDLKEEAVFALGCPAMGDEILEEAEMEPLVQAVEGIASGKTIALFGSYGWGDGQWMREWEERMKKAGAQIIGGEGLICQESPDEAALSKCRELGKRLADMC